MSKLADSIRSVLSEANDKVETAPVKDKTPDEAANLLIDPSAQEIDALENLAITPTKDVNDTDKGAAVSADEQLAQLHKAMGEAAGADVHAPIEVKGDKEDDADDADDAALIAIMDLDADDIQGDECPQIVVPDSTEFGGSLPHSGDELSTPADKNRTAMGVPMMPVIAMGTYMRESLEGIVTESTKIEVDRSNFKALFESKNADGEQVIELSEDFVTQASALFEETCNAKVQEITKVLVEATADAAIALYEDKVAEQVAIAEAAITTTANEWLAQNTVAIKESLRADLMESFIANLHEVFTSHYIDVPESRVNLLEAFRERAEKLEESVSAEINNTLKMKIEMDKVLKENALLKFTTQMSAVQREKLMTLAEDVKFVDTASFLEKLKMLSESVSAPAAGKTILEDVGTKLDTKKQPVESEVHVNPLVSAAIAAQRESKTY